MASFNLDGVIRYYMKAKGKSNVSGTLLTGCVTAAVGVLAAAGVHSPASAFNHAGATITALGLIAFAFGTSVRQQSGTTVVVFPLWFLEFCDFAMWPINFWIGIIGCYAQKKLNIYPEDPLLNPEGLRTRADALDDAGLAALKAKILSYGRFVCEENDVVQLFDTLPPATVETMVGRTFKGTALRTTSILDYLRTHVLDVLEDNFSIGAGKRFFSQYIGDPFIMRTKDNGMIFPYPGLGNVGMHMIEYRGKSQITMVYDNQPWQDMFRILDDGKESGAITVLGVWATREVAGGWFCLTELPGLETMNY